MGLIDWRRGGTGLALVAMLFASAAFSQPAPSSSEPSAETAASQAALADIEATLSLSRERTEALKREIAEMQGDRDKQNAALIAAGERVKRAEADVTAVEEKLDALIIQELETRGRLDGADGSVSNILAALERISRNPPPALIVDPSDALGSARSAMLISSILPQLQARADAVMADLRHLNEIKAEAQAEEVRLRANFNVLEEEQLRIATLIAARQQNVSTATANLAAEQAAEEALTQRAAGLKQLIDDLAKRAAAVATAADATARANAGGTTPSLDTETVRLALANTTRTEPAVPFASAKGFLAFPTGGVAVINFGDSDGFGGISKGLSIVTRAGAPVLAPADGWVIYEADYLNYGKILVLDTGQNYTVLLAGLQNISVSKGQFVLLGQQIGTMGSRTISRTIATGAGIQSPTLYIEMRKDSTPIDPTGWWAPSNTNTTQSG